MKAFFRSKTFITLAVTICILVGIIIYSAGTGGNLIANVFGVVITPMQKVSATVTNNAQTGLSNAARSYEDLVAENEALKQQVNVLKQQLVEFYQYKQENAQLKNYLELKESNPDYQFVSAGVVNRDANDMNCSFTLDKGSSAGVKINDPVITEQGVVGWVSQVSAMYCRVTTILSGDTSIAATDKVNRESGVVGCNLLLADSGLVKLGLLEAGTTVQTGDIIVTSGIGGKFPKDLLIGTALEVKPEENDVSLYATVQPFVDIKTVRDVIIITGFNGQGELLDSAEDKQ